MKHLKMGWLLRNLHSSNCTQFWMVFIFIFLCAIQSIHHTFGWCDNNNVKDFIAFKLYTRWQFYYLFLSIITYKYYYYSVYPLVGRPAYHKKISLQKKANILEFHPKEIRNRKTIQRRVPSVNVVWHSHSHLIV